MTQEQSAGTTRKFIPDEALIAVLIPAPPYTVGRDRYTPARYVGKLRLTDGTEVDIIGDGEVQPVVGRDGRPSKQVVHLDVKRNGITLMSLDQVNGHYEGTAGDRGTEIGAHWRSGRRFCIAPAECYDNWGVTETASVTSDLSIAAMMAGAASTQGTTEVPVLDIEDDTLPF